MRSYEANEASDNLRSTVDRIEAQHAALVRAGAALQAKCDALADALFRIMPYAHDGASVHDVDTSEQPEFIRARAALAAYEGSK